MVRSLTGDSLNEALGWERNNFDRVVHFSYGLLLAYPIREVFLRIAGVRGFWGYFLPLDLTMSTLDAVRADRMGRRASSSAATSARPISARKATCGTRTRTWRWPRSARSSRCASPPASTIYLQRDFAHEWAESLRIHGRQPLGEVAIKQMLDQKGSA